MQRDDRFEQLRTYLRRGVAVAAVALSVFLVTSVGDDSGASDLHLAVVAE